MTMALDDIPLMSMLKSRFGYLSQQQRGIAVNVANSDTPDYVPTDLKPFSYSLGTPSITPGGTMALAPVRTNAAHLPGDAAATGQTWKAQPTPDSEARLDGNQVVLEEQMMKMSKARGDYEAAINFYEKSLSLIQLALKAPGKP
jgi:flagellar basal-body rod protein FlgB